MGVSKHGKPLDLSNGKWVPIFLNAVGEDQIRREGYLCHAAANGEVACKACGRYLPYTVPLDAHFRGHLAELDHYLAEHREDADEKAKQNLAKARAVRSVKKKAAAGLADTEYTPEELALLEEFGV